MCARIPDYFLRKKEAKDDLRKTWKRQQIKSPSTDFYVGLAGETVKDHETPQQVFSLFYFCLAMF